MTNLTILDTDVLVDVVRGRPAAVAYIRKVADRVILSAIVVAELYAGARGESELANLDEFLSRFPVAPVTSDVARIAGIYKRDYRRSHGISLADAIVAATATAQRAELVTFNVKHYPMFSGLEPPYAER